MSSMNYGGESLVDPGTMRGRDWPCLRQFGVFLENRVGRLHDLLKHIERDDLRVVALSISDTIDCVIVRIIMSNYERAVELLKLAGFTFFECDIIAVELPEDRAPARYPTTTWRCRGRRATAGQSPPCRSRWGTWTTSPSASGS